MLLLSATACWEDAEKTEAVSSHMYKGPEQGAMCTSWDTENSN